MSFFDSRKTTISISLFIAIVLVVGAYILSGRHVTTGTVANAESTEALLKTYAVKDSDTDGLPDWEEALYGTDPNNAHTVRPNLTDGEAVAQGLATAHYAGQPKTATTSVSVDVAAQIPGPTAAPGSLTDQFSKLFFNNYIATRGDTKPTAAQMQTFIRDAVAELSKTRVEPDAYSASQMNVTGTGAPALIAYAAQVDSAFAKNITRLPYSEMAYFSDAVTKNDRVALKNVAAIGASYTKIAQAIVAVSAPQEAAKAHLSLVNALARLGTTITDFSTLNDDPIKAMLALSEYPKDATALASALGQMKPVFAADAVVISSDSPGYALYTLAQLGTPATP